MADSPSPTGWAGADPGSAAWTGLTGSTGPSGWSGVQPERSRVPVAECADPQAEEPPVSTELTVVNSARGSRGSGPLLGNRSAKGITAALRRLPIGMDDRGFGRRVRYRGRNLERLCERGFESGGAIQGRVFGPVRQFAMGS